MSHGAIIDSAIIIVPGDPSVGIQDHTIDVSGLGVDLGCIAEDDREIALSAIVAALRTLGEEATGERAHVVLYATDPDHVRSLLHGGNSRRLTVEPAPAATQEPPAPSVPEVELRAWAQAEMEMGERGLRRVQEAPRRRFGPDRSGLTAAQREAQAQRYAGIVRGARRLLAWLDTRDS